VTAVCIDVGTATCKVGFAGDEAPRTLFPTVLGRSKAHSNISDY
jgi:actin beta/gamma 1